MQFCFAWESLSKEHGLEAIVALANVQQHKENVWNSGEWNAHGLCEGVVSNILCDNA